MDLKVQRSQCSAHPDQSETGKCGACGRGICRECVSEFGYFCSEECRETTKSQITASEKAETANTMAHYQRGMKIFKALGLVVGLCVLMGMGYFVWLKFFDVRGTVVWRWKPGKDAGMVRVLGGDDDSVLLHASGTLYRLRLSDGKILSQTECTELDAMMQVKVLPDRIVAWGLNKFISMDVNGGGAVTISLGEVGAINPTFDEEYENAWFVEQEFNEGKITFRLHHMQLNEGAQARIKELKQVEIVRLLGVHDKNPVLLQLRKAGRRSTGGWCIRLTKDGKTSQMTLDDQPDWGPELENGWLKWRKGATLHVASLNDDRTYTFDLPSDDFYFEPATIIRGEQLLLALPGGTVCCNLKDGKAMWKSKLTINDNLFYTTDDTFITLGTRSENVEIDMSGLGGANQVPGDLLKEMGLPSGKMNRKKHVPVLAAINRKTGKIEWKVEHVRGSMIADDTRIAFVMDTAVTGALMGTEEPSLFVRQFDVNSGREVVNRQSKDVRHIGRSTLVGRYAINVYQGNFIFGDEAAMTTFGVKRKPSTSEYPEGEEVIVQAILLD